jgi:hypothetical protein
MSEGTPEAEPKRRRRRRRRAKAPDSAGAPTTATTAEPRVPEGLAEAPARPRRAEDGERPRPPRPNPPETPEGLARAALVAFDRLVTALAAEHGHASRQDAVPEVLTTLVTQPGRKSLPDSEVAGLVEALRAQVGEAIRSVTAFHEGRVYCFFTDAPDAPYSRPPQPTDVFAGFSANGRPEWVSFTNLCLARQEPRVDRLFADQPELIALVLHGHELAGGLLPGFGRDSLAWRLHGQVVCGLIPRNLNPRTRTEDRLALTLQLIETQQGGARGRLRLNILGLSPEHIAEAAANADPMSSAEAFRRLVRATRERVDQLGRRAALALRRGERFDLAEHVTGLLTRLRSDVLRVFRARDHRTLHAEERHRSGERPTSTALADALAATEGKLLHDAHKDTWVVLGPRLRVHVFSRLGRHVTSLELEPHEVARRVDLGRWRPVARHAAELFQLQLKAQLHGEAAPVGEVRGA